MNNTKPESGKARFIELCLRGFEFPKDLEDGKANFRFVVDVRYLDGEGKLAVHQAVMPSMDTYWECDTGKGEKPNYVRADDGAKFEMASIDPWDRLVFLGAAHMIHSVQVKVFDVDRADFWDKLQDALGRVIGSLFGKFKSLIPVGQNGTFSSAASDVYGSYVDDLSSTVAKKLSNGDKVLFRGSWPKSRRSGPMTIRGAGTSGQYVIRIDSNHLGGDLERVKS